MSKYGRKVAYDLQTGNVLADIGEMQGAVREVTIEQMINVYASLSERNRETFDVLELPFGEYQQDFAESNGYRVNVATKELEFSYPDPNVPEAPPVFLQPLTEQVEDLRTQLKTTNDTVDFLLGM